MNGTCSLNSQAPGRIGKIPLTSIIRKRWLASSRYLSRAATLHAPSSFQGRVYAFLGSPRRFFISHLTQMEQILIEEIILPRFGTRYLVPARIGKYTFRVERLIRRAAEPHTLFEDASLYRPSYPSSSSPRRKNNGCKTTRMLALCLWQPLPSPSPSHPPARGRTSRSDLQGHAVSRKGG